MRIRHATDDDRDALRRLLGLAVRTVDTAWANNTWEAKSPSSTARLDAALFVAEDDGQLSASSPPSEDTSRASATSCLRWARRTGAGRRCRDGDREPARWRLTHLLLNGEPGALALHGLVGRSRATRARPDVREVGGGRFTADRPDGRGEPRRARRASSCRACAAAPGQHRRTRNGWVAVYDDACDRDRRCYAGSPDLDWMGAVVPTLGVEVEQVVRASS